MTRWVVLGSRGFIGHAVIRQLEAEGEECRGFGSQELDLRDSRALQRLDDLVNADCTVVMCSALTPDRGTNLQTLADNFAISRNVAAFLGTHPPARCLYLSSDAVYPMMDEPISENSQVLPDNPYALAKYNGERMLDFASAEAGFSLLLLRPAAVYGPGDTHNSYGPNRFVRAAVKERRVRIFGEGEEMRDHLFVEDLVRLSLTLARSDATGVVNLATGESRSFASVIECIRSLAPSPFEVEHLPRASAVTHRSFDVSRLRSLVHGFSFTPFEQGMQRTLQAALADAT